MQTIKAVADQFGVTYDTLRYYEKIGLIPPIQRDTQGRRQYSDTDVAALNRVIHLRQLGASIADCQWFNALFNQGPLTPDTYTTAIQYLQSLNHQLDQRIQDMQDQQKFLAQKINRLQDEQQAISKRDLTQ